MRLLFLNFVLATILNFPTHASVAPMAESDQAAKALKILDAYAGMWPATPPS